MVGSAPCVRAIVALFTGVRRGELLALRWPNVDLDGKVMRLREALEDRNRDNRWTGGRLGPPWFLAKNAPSR
jgi:integrase